MHSYIGKLETALTAEERARRQFGTEAAAERAARAQAQVQAQSEARTPRQAEQARRDLGRLARLRAAWRGQ